MPRAECHFTVVDGVPSAIAVTDGALPDGNFVIGWGMDTREENLIVMFSPGDGESTLFAQARTFFPRVTAAMRQAMAKRT